MTLRDVVYKAVGEDLFDLGIDRAVDVVMRAVEADREQAVTIDGVRAVPRTYWHAVCAHCGEDILDAAGDDTCALPTAEQVVEYATSDDTACPSCNADLLAAVREETP